MAAASRAAGGGEQDPAPTDRTDRSTNPKASTKPEASNEPETPERFASLHDLLDDDPYLDEPFWPPVLLGLGLVVVISLLVLWKHGVLRF